ncbi:MAG: DUF11 domain-containing protein [Chloroflexi bacterium]|nr:DUF11 domain-containing protein [Chloroflexota bacterium]
MMRLAGRSGLGLLGLPLLVFVFMLLLPETVTAVSTTVQPPQFSIQRGFYDAPLTVELSTITPGAEIRYTLDFSAPTTDTSALYTDPINITTTATIQAIAYLPDESLEPSEVIAHTYIFLDDVVNQFGVPDGYPTHWSEDYPADYDMDPEIVTAPAYSSVMTDALTAVPTLSIVTDQNNLFGTDGIYQNPLGEGVTWERPTSVELIYPDGSPGFQINAGIRIFGGASREPHKSPKHAFRLLFKGIYGPTKLEFPLFGGRATDRFDTLVLRAGYNNTWIHSNAFSYPPYDNRLGAQYARDKWASDTQLAMGQVSGHGIYVHLYLNGIYWGLYNLHERPSNTFLGDYFGGDKEEYDAINSGEAIDGDLTAWNTMMALANANAGLAGEAEYEAIQSYLDVENLIDFIILNHYAGNQDWDDHNWHAGRRRVADAGFKFFVWDSERILEDVTHNVVSVNLSNKPSRLFQQLRDNEEFRMLFADHVYRHLFNEGALTAVSTTTRYQSQTDEIVDAVVAESARWGDYRRDVVDQYYPPYELYTRDDHWLVERDQLLIGYFPARTAVLLQQYRDADLYPAINPPQFSQDGGNITPGFTLTISNSNGITGTIYYTLDGSDPRLPYGGGVSGTAVDGNDLAQVTLTETTAVNARVYNFAASEWSALQSADFYAPADFSGLLITEIMYHPFDGDDYEFVEIKNTGAISLDLGGVHFSDGISYTFAAGTVMSPTDFVVLARFPDFFEEKYGFVPTNDTGYMGKLSNGGETVTLSDSLDAAITSVAYDDETPWPASPDGGGFSLVPIDPNANPDPDDPANWRASSATGGSPGADDPAPTIAPILVNEILAHTDDPLLDMIELHNPTTDTVDLSYWFLTDNIGNPTRYQIANGTVISAGGYLTFDEDGFGFGLSSLGEEVYLFSGDVSGALTGYSHGFAFGASENGVSFGRHLISTGDERFPAQSANTLGAINTYPRVGPIVISQIMYNPDGADEFLELTNITNDDVPLYDTENVTNTWQITGVGGYTFTHNAVVPAGGRILVVDMAPAAFRAAYNVPVEVQIFGPYPGGLSNGGELISLQMPGLPELDGTVPYIVVDEVNYDDKAPWPTEPDGDGPALRRVSNVLYGDDPANWEAFDEWSDWPEPKRPDLEIVKTVLPETAVIPGQSITYTLTFTNVGSDIAASVVITDMVSLTVTNTAVVVSSVDIVARPGVFYIWDVPDLAVGAGGAVTITGVVDGEVEETAVLTNSVEIASVIAETTLANNASAISVNIIPQKYVYLPIILRPDY